MTSNKERDLQINLARRHFLGMTAATSARVAATGALVATTLLPPSAANALGRRWWKKDGDPDGDPMCFLRGTSIATPAGEVCIEDLQIGDLVQTMRGKAMAIKWIGHHSYRRSGRTWNAGVVPIRVSKHALGESMPHKDLYLSPGHALFVDGDLIRVQDLVNGISIAPAVPTDGEMIEYFHIVLDAHEVILAEGMPVESFLLDAGSHERFANFAEFARLYPDGSLPAMTPFVPVVGYGGRKHLKALLRLGISRFVPSRKPALDVYDRIAARAGQMAG
jgi:hypothetical protein